MGNKFVLNLTYIAHIEVIFEKKNYFSPSNVDEELDFFGTEKDCRDKQSSFIVKDGFVSWMCQGPYDYDEVGIKKLFRIRLIK